MKICIVNDCFYPGYKAGGPIQSLTNLAETMGDVHEIFVITSAYDMDSAEVYPNIITNSWNNITLPALKNSIKVWYAAKNVLSTKKYVDLLKEIQPTFIYINGVFSYTFFIVPLFVIKKLPIKPQVIICPRGMFQKGALAGKRLKKTFYLKALLFSRLLKNVKWHATNAEERDDILKRFPGSKVNIALNIPKVPLPAINFPSKTTGSLKLIYLSLITEKKNLLFLLQLIKSAKNIKLDIYGPVKDNEYWDQCKKLIDQMPVKARYKGNITPFNVQETFSLYDASVLLTKGENFGHALYESLSVGRPIITSYFTPWNNLPEKKAGWNLDISNINKCIAILNEIVIMDENKFNEFCLGAHKLSLNYYNNLEPEKTYNHLFSSN